VSSLERVRHGARVLARGALRPPENDSAFLLDPHRRAVPTERMARYAARYPADALLCAFGGSTLGAYPVASMKDTNTVVRSTRLFMSNLLICLFAASGACNHVLENRVEK